MARFREGLFFCRFLFREIVFSLSSFHLVPIEEIRMKTQKLLAGLAILLTTLGGGIQDYLTAMKTTMKGVEGFVQDNWAMAILSIPRHALESQCTSSSDCPEAAWELRDRSPQRRDLLRGTMSFGINTSRLLPL